LVTARAVADLRVLLEYTAPLCAVGGLLAFPKGSGLVEENAAAGAAIEALGLERAGTATMRAEVSETLSVALFRKVKATDARYPRRAGVPERRPL
jgi:16S rRNA (guanine527-N7)-methyltransferase